MPTYQYECGSCGHAFEAFQSMADKKLKKCPVCARPQLKRLIGSGSGIIFKGTGFYETDYKRKSPVKDAKDSHAPAPSTAPSTQAGQSCCKGSTCSS